MTRSIIDHSCREDPAEFIAEQSAILRDAVSGRHGESKWWRNACKESPTRCLTSSEVETWSDKLHDRR
jgi:hypothetical protein